jgi:hypothetical protein
MLWLVVVAGGIGILLGLWLRVHAAIAASGVIVLASVALLPFVPWSLIKAVMFTFALLGALQCGYLAGSMLSLVRTRANAPQRATDLPSYTLQRNG